MKKILVAGGTVVLLLQSAVLWIGFVHLSEAPETVFIRQCTIEQPVLTPARRPPPVSPHNNFTNFSGKNAR